MNRLFHHNTSAGFDEVIPLNGRQYVHLLNVPHTWVDCVLVCTCESLSHSGGMRGKES